MKDTQSPGRGRVLFCSHLCSLQPCYQKQNFHVRKEMGRTQRFTLCCNKNQGVLNHSGGSKPHFFICQVKLYYSLQPYDCWWKLRYQYSHVLELGCLFHITNSLFKSYPTIFLVPYSFKEQSCTFASEIHMLAFQQRCFKDNCIA